MRFGLFELRLGLIDLRLLAINLCRNIGDVGFRNRHLRLRLVDRDPVVPVVDAGEQITRVDVLIVGDGNRSDITADFCRDREAARGHECIVGRFIMADVEPVSEAADQRDQKDACPDGGEDPMFAQTVSPRLLAWGSLCFLGLGAPAGSRRLFRATYRR